jgi:hypothetical protein
VKGRRVLPFPAGKPRMNDSWRLVAIEKLRALQDSSPN